MNEFHAILRELDQLAALAPSPAREQTQAGDATDGGQIIHRLTHGEPTGWPDQFLMGEAWDEEEAEAGEIPENDSSSAESRRAETCNERKPAQERADSSAALAAESRSGVETIDLGQSDQGQGSLIESESSASPAVTISTEKKGGDEPCAATASTNTGRCKEIPIVPSTGTTPQSASNTRPDGPTPSGAGLLAFDLAKALAGAKVVTRGGCEVSRIKSGDGIIDVWTKRGDAFTVWSHGSYRFNKHEHPLDLFLAPQEDGR